MNLLGKRYHSENSGTSFIENEERTKIWDHLPFGNVSLLLHSLEELCWKAVSVTWGSFLVVQVLTPFFSRPGDLVRVCKSCVLTPSLK